MNTAPGTARDVTRDRIRTAFYKIGILNTDKQYEFARQCGFELSGTVTALPSFLNLSEADAQKLLERLTGECGYLGCTLDAGHPTEQHTDGKDWWTDEGP